MEYLVGLQNLNLTRFFQGVFHLFGELKTVNRESALFDDFPNNVSKVDVNNKQSAEHLFDVRFDVAFDEVHIVLDQLGPEGVELLELLERVFGLQASGELFAPVDAVH